MKQRKFAFSSVEKQRFSTKGQGLPINTMILIILGLIVLGALIWVFQTQVRKGVSGYEQVGGKGDITPDRCQTIINERVCTSSCPDKYQSVTPPSTGWIDCKEPRATCCEPVPA